MNEDTGVHYLTPWKINETIEGLGGIGEIIEILGIFFSTYTAGLNERNTTVYTKHKFDITEFLFLKEMLPI